MVAVLDGQLELPFDELDAIEADGMFHYAQMLQCPNDGLVGTYSGYCPHCGLNLLE